MNYKLYFAGVGTGSANAAMTVGVDPCKSFLFDKNNEDYQKFKLDIQSGTQLQDADGNLMTAEAAKQFVATLP